MLFGALLVACAERDVDSELLGLDISIAQLRSFAVADSSPIVDDYFIEGYIVANDKIGELHNAVVIYDGTAGVELHVESDDIDRLLPLFAEVRLRCSGLSLGREGGKVVLGAPPTKSYVVDRVTEESLATLLRLRDLPPSPPQSRRCAIADITAEDMSSYISIEGVTFVEARDNACWCEYDIQNMSYRTTLRHIAFERDTLAVVVDGRAAYAGEVLPQGRVTCFGVVDSYNSEIALRIVNQGVKR